MNWLLSTLALPAVGLPTIFVVALVSATLLPIGSEPAVFAYVKLNPEMFWAAILVATLGNTVGGMISWWMGLGAKLALLRLRNREARRAARVRIDGRVAYWFRRTFLRIGPPVLLLSWLPGIGDPLCAVAGWMRLPALPCALWMAVGKFLRYLTMTAVLLWIPDGFWQQLLAPLRALVG